MGDPKRSGRHRVFGWAATALMPVAVSVMSATG
jgi:hypothetical protein